MYDKISFHVHVFGVITGTLWDGSDASRNFDVRLRTFQSLESVIRKQCEMDFRGGGKIHSGEVEVTYIRDSRRRVTRFFDIRQFKSISEYLLR